MKISTLKKISFSAMAAVIILGVGGCMFEPYQSKSYEERVVSGANKIRDEILSHMREKYGREFVAVSFSSRGLGQSYDRLTCHAEGDDPEIFGVYVNRYGDGADVSFADNYFGIQIHEEVENKVLGVLEDMGLEAKAFGRGGEFFDNEFDRTKTFEDLINSSCRYGPSALAGVKWTLDEDTYDTSQQFFQLVKEDGYKGNLYLYFFNEEDFNDFERDTTASAIRSDNVISSYRMLYIDDKIVDLRGEMTHD